MTPPPQTSLLLLVLMLLMLLLSLRRPPEGRAVGRRRCARMAATRGAPAQGAGAAQRATHCHSAG